METTTPSFDDIARASVQWIPPVPRQEILSIAARLAAGAKHSAGYLAAHPVVGVIVESIPYTDPINSCLGGLWERHALSVDPCDLGFEPSEPQLTKALTYFLNGAGDSTTGVIRSRAFLLALMEELSGYGAINDSLRHTRSIEVSAEVSAGSRFLDLRFAWETGGFRYAIAVEAKFGHHVTIGQLPAYRQLVRKWADEGNWALILLNLDGSLSLKNKDWEVVTWRSLLPRWERLLRMAGERDDHFAQFRRLLWDKIKG